MSRDRQLGIRFFKKYRISFIRFFLGKSISEKAKMTLKCFLNMPTSDAKEQNLRNFQKYAIQANSSFLGQIDIRDDENDH